MIEIKIPKEVTKYEAKLVGPFTSRQFLALVVCVPLCIIAYNLAAKYLASSVAPYFCIPFAVLGALFGWVKPYGLKFEDFFKSVILRSFISPTKRIQKSHNYYSLLCEKINSLTPEEEFVLNAKLEGLSEDEIESMVKKLKKKKNTRKEKYKKSKKAIF